MSLLTGSEESKDFERKQEVSEMQSQQIPSDLDCQAKQYSLTKLQEEISYAVETINLHYFVDLGGVTYYDINFEGRLGFPLKIAAFKGHSGFVKLMLENKMIDINKTDSEGLNAFWIAGRCGHGEIMQVLAEHGIDIFNKDKQGNNVLHTAARYPERKNILRMLLDSNFPTDLKNADGDTALHIAAQRNNKEAIELLLEAGAEIDELNNHSITPLYLAILNEKSEESETAQELLNAGAQVFIDGTDEQKDRSPIFLVIRRDQAKLLGVMYLHTQKAQEIKNSQGLTPLMYAAKNNKTKIVEFLTIASNTDLNQEDKNGCTILIHVLKKGGKEDLKMARKLVAGGADVNYVDVYGNTPLIQMIKLDIRDSVKFLLDKGADPHICDSGGEDTCELQGRQNLQ